MIPHCGIIASLWVWKFQQTHLLGKRFTPPLGSRALGFEEPSCVLEIILVEVFLLNNIANNLAGFSPLLRRVSRDTSYVLVHGVSSCDLGCCNIIVYG
jgi:hypothetical protein